MVEPARLVGARGVEDRRELAGMAKHDETIEVVAQRELSRRLGWGGRRRAAGECEPACARARRPRRLEREVVAVLGRQDSRVARGVELRQHRQHDGLEHDTAADARPVARHRALDEDAMTEPRRSDGRADVGLQRQEVELAVVLAEPARHGGRIANDRAGHEVAPLGRHVLRGERRRDERGNDERDGVQALHSAPKNATRSRFSCSE